MKRKSRWIILTALMPFVVIALLAVALYLPPVQNWVVGKVTAYASRQTGMEIAVDYVRLRFPLDLEVEGVRVTRGNDSLPRVTDTVADIKKVVVDVRLLPLLRQQVMVDELRFSKMKFNTGPLIHEARVEGTIGLMRVTARGIDLARDSVHVDEALLADAHVAVALSDTVAEDTSSTTNPWRIHVTSLRVKDSRVAVTLPGDTLRIGVAMGDATVRETSLDLAQGKYQVAGIDWTDGGVAYDNMREAAVAGIDPNHIAIEDLALRADSLCYHDPFVKLSLRECAFRERCGLQVTELTGDVAMDSTTLHLPDLRLRTTASEIVARVEMDLNSFDEKAPGELIAIIHGTVGKHDLVGLTGDLPSGFWKQWPNYPLTIDGSMKGNISYLSLAGLKVELPTAFRVVAKGWMADVTHTDKWRADIDIDARAYRLPFVTGLLDKETAEMVRIPDNISMKGKVTARGDVYGGKLTMTEGDGSVDLDGNVDIERMAYDVRVAAVNFQVDHFLPGQDLKPFTGEVTAKGVGTDFLSTNTQLEAEASVVAFGVGDYALDNMTGSVALAKGKLYANVESDNDLLIGSVAVEGFTDTRKQLQATMAADVRRADLYHLGVTEKPLKLSVCGHLDVATNYEEYYRVEGLFSDLHVEDEERQYQPEAVMIDLLTRKDTTHVEMETGDFRLRVDGKGGYASLLDQGNHLVEEMKRQFLDRRIDQAMIRRKFPTMDVALSMGKENLVARALHYFGYGVKEARMDMASSPETGIEGTMAIDSLVVAGMRIDTIRSRVHTVEDSIRYQLLVANNKDNPQYVFRSYTDGEISERGSDINTRLYDAQGELGLELGLAAILEKEGVRVSLIDRHPVLGYKTFTANEDNYIYLGTDQRVYARMMLEADDGTGIHLYSDNDNTEALQDLTLSLGNIDIGEVLSVIPYMPDIDGTLNGDFHVILTKEEMSLVSNLTIDNMAYEQGALGNVGSEFVYMPKADGSHYIDGILLTDGDEVAQIQGSYLSEGDGYIDASLAMERMPLQFLNGFLPSKLVALRGYGEGTLDVKGALSRPVVNGEVLLDSSFVTSPAYGVQMRFADVPVRITDSRLRFENFEMYSDNGSPLTITGELDFSDLDNMNMDIQMMAQNFQLINAKKTRDSEAYGKAFVNFMGRMRGPVTSLTMMGRLDVLGSTDMTYLLKESELTTDTELDELVKFTDFSDSTATVVNRPALEGFTMALNINIDESAHILCGLNADLSNYIDLMGGGELRMTYSPSGDLQLNGKYTLSDGIMKYSLPVIPLKSFAIEDGSYIEFTGDPMNPTLSITATEQVKATVDEGDGSGRSVDFLCGVKLTQTLSQPGIQFIISAPDDMTTQDELNTMDDEERGKIAITMLASGMYLASGNTASFSMNNALTSYLNAEINNIMGSAMRSIGLDVGMSVDNSTTSSGDTHTDYNFKFFKRLWNNRLNVSVGGQVSSGADLDYGNSNDAFLDNVELEYRLDKKSSMYIKAFYDNSTYDWLEGLIGEYGAGFVWRRKLSHFSDIFRLKTKETALPVPRVRNDSIPNDKTSDEKE